MTTCVRQEKMILIAAVVLAVACFGILLGWFFTYKMNKMESEIRVSMRVESEVREGVEKMLWERIKSHYEIMDYKIAEQEEKTKEAERKIDALGKKLNINSWEW